MLSGSLHLPGCLEASERLSEFLDGELDEATRREVVIHLAICSACAQLAAELAATVHALHTLRSGARGSEPSLAHEARRRRWSCP
jgi:anti-sigma factor RsiW